MTLLLQQKVSNLKPLYLTLTVIGGVLLLGYGYISQSVLQQHIYNDLINETQPTLLVRNYTEIHHSKQTVDLIPQVRKATISGPLNQEPILTLFTTIKDRAPRVDIHHRTIANWASFRPDVIPVLFIAETDNDTRWHDEARSKGWDVRILTKLRQGVPILKEMFIDILNNVTTPFVGYANADIIFDSSLVHNLRNLAEKRDINNMHMFLVGCRTNVNISVWDLGTGTNISLIQKAGTNNNVFHAMAQDYFIMTQKGLPWKNIPDFVVGRNGYDNWLVSKVQEWNIPLIDMTSTLLAIHQVGTDGVKSGSRLNHDQRRMNVDLVNKDFNYMRGSIICAHYGMTCKSSIRYGFLCPKEDLLLNGKSSRHKFCRPLKGIRLLSGG